MHRLTFRSLLCHFLVLVWLAPSQARGQSEDFQDLGQRIVGLVREHFYDATRAGSWASMRADYAAQADSLASFAELTKRALSELNTSHTNFYTPLEPDYYGLLSIYSAALRVDAIEFEGVGADFTPEHFVRVVFAGGPAAQAGLRRGDKILKVDGHDFDPVGSFLRKDGQQVMLTVQRKPGQPLIDLPVTARKVNPKHEWLEAQRAGSKIIERTGKRVAYVPMFSCAGDEYVVALRTAINEKFQQADALILDFRDGWGGCGPEFVNVFNSLPPVLTYIDRNGKQKRADSQWRKPLYLLVNRGTRSGKEEVAFTVKKHKVGTLIGERTAGAVMGGRCFLLPGNLLLYLATLDVLTDGQRLEGQGVLPDVEVASGLPFAAGEDPQLEKALQLAAR